MKKIFFAIPFVLASSYFLLKNKKTDDGTNGKKEVPIKPGTTKYNTWDKYTNQRLNYLHPKIRTWAYAFILLCEQQGYKVRIAGHYRTWAAQTKLYNQGRTSAGDIITQAKARESYHNYGLAIDVYEIKNGKIHEGNRDTIAAIGKGRGFVWGGDWKGFKDRPHFQKTFGYNIKKLQQKYDAGQLKDGYVII